MTKNTKAWLIRANELKTKQLGINHSTASARLIKDILFKFLKEKDINCYHCNQQMTREDFSIEHKIPWLHADNALELFFDLDNIGFSHLKCNVMNRRVPEKFTDEEIRIRRNKRNAEYRARTYCPIKRRERYIAKGY